MNETILDALVFVAAEYGKWKQPFWPRYGRTARVSVGEETIVWLRSRTTGQTRRLELLQNAIFCAFPCRAGALSGQQTSSSPPQSKGPQSARIPAIRHSVVRSCRSLSKGLLLWNTLDMEETSTANRLPADRPIDLSLSQTSSR